MAQFNIRDLPSRTDQQIEQLCSHEGYTKTQAVILAIGGLWDAAHQRLHFEIAQEEAGACPWCGWAPGETLGW
jgi:hypothetical protein